MNPAPARHFPGIRYGLIGGVCVVILSLIGMVEAFNQREIVTDVITMGQTLLLLMAAFVAYLGAQRAQPRRACHGARFRHRLRADHGGPAFPVRSAGQCRQPAAGVHQCLPAAVPTADLRSGEPWCRHRPAPAGRRPGRAVGRPAQPDVGPGAPGADHRLFMRHLRRDASGPGYTDPGRRRGRFRISTISCIRETACVSKGR